MIISRLQSTWIQLVFLMLIVQFSCDPEEQLTMISVETGAIEEVGPTHCIIHGEILEVAKQGIFHHGFVWSEAPESSIETGSFHTLGQAYDPGTFSATITGLAPNTTYYVRAYATGVGQVDYGSESSFITADSTAPILHTIPAFIVRSYSAVAGGNILSDGGSEITTRGVCWSTSPYPSMEDDHTMDGAGSGSFESELNDLEPYTVYFFRAYAINHVGISYGENFGLLTLWDDSNIEDVEGNEYATVQIGEQVWMADNLRSVHYADGSPIPKVEDSMEWSALLSDAEAFCYYESSDAAFETYGALYTWPAAMHGSESSDEVPSQVQGVCPDGWHLPSDKEWIELELHLGLKEIYTRDDGWRGWDEGGKLKQTGTSLWVEPNEMATNSSGFSAIPGGFRDADGMFMSGGSFTAFWSTTGYDSDGAWLRGLHAGRGELLRDVYPRKDGFSVRCIKDK